MKLRLQKLWYNAWLTVMGVAAALIGMKAHDPVVADCPNGEDHSHLFLTFHRKITKQPSTQESNIDAEGS